MLSHLVFFAEVKDIWWHFLKIHKKENVEKRREIIQPKWFKALKFKA